MKPDIELGHVDRQWSPDETPGGVGLVRLTADAAGDAAAVLDRARDVMRVILEHSHGDWPVAQEWTRDLPGSFVMAAGEEESREEAERWLVEWRELSPSDQVTASRAAAWSLSDWLYWMDPIRREWHWWDGAADDPHHLWVEVVVDGWPTAVGALRWLLKASGADQISDPD